MIKPLLASLLVTLVTSPAFAAGRCPPAGYDRAELEALKAANFEIADAGARHAFARALTACLGARDPFLRDQIAFEGLSRLLRARQLDTATQTALLDDVLPRLEARDRQGFERPFAALVVSELVRADRIEAYLSDEMYATVNTRAVTYLQGVEDYRGYDAREGWRHGVAHGADLMLQLVLNPRTSREQLLAIRDAVSAKVAPSNHSYIYGESERLARPILFMARRGALTEAEWTPWLQSLAPTGDDVFSSQAGLARRHNATAFLQAIWLNARLGENTADDVLLPSAEAALRAIP